MSEIWTAGKGGVLERSLINELEFFKVWKASQKSRSGGEEQNWIIFADKRSKWWLAVQQCSAIKATHIGAL